MQKMSKSTQRRLLRGHRNLSVRHKKLSKVDISIIIFRVWLLSFVKICLHSWNIIVECLRVQTTIMCISTVQREDTYDRSFLWNVCVFLLPLVVYYRFFLSTYSLCGFTPLLYIATSDNDSWLAVACSYLYGLHCSIIV